MDSFIQDELKIKKDHQIKYNMLEKEYYQLLNNDFSRLKEVKNNDLFINKSSKYITIFIILLINPLIFKSDINTTYLLIDGGISIASFFAINPLLKQVLKNLNHCVNNKCSNLDYDQVVNRLKQLNNEMIDLEKTIENVDAILETYKCMEDFETPSFDEIKEDNNIKKRVRRK